MFSARERFFLVVFIFFALLNGAYGQYSGIKIKEYKVPKGSHPHDVAPAPDGTVWVADAYNYRVVAFDRDGKVVSRFGKYGTKPGQFDVSAGIALLPGGRLAVADFMNHRVQVWTRKGEFVGAFGVQGGRFSPP